VKKPGKSAKSERKAKIVFSFFTGFEQIFGWIKLSANKQQPVLLVQKRCLTIIAFTVRNGIKSAGIILEALIWENLKHP
jgi:hypothetical protein